LASQPTPGQTVTVPKIPVRRKRTPFCLSALAAMTFCAAPAFAADVVGKWYGKTDVDPVIIIDKAGSEYSASLVDIDSTRPLVRDRVYQESIHKSLVSLKVVGGNVQFSIRNLISENGDINYERDEYNLNLSEDGGELIGTVRRIINYEGTDKPSMTVAPITLFPGDWNSRNTKSQP
jgi:hypothetical protein